MSAWIFEHLRAFFADFGYGVIVLILLLENAGIPVPGETTLLFASFLAWSEHTLKLPWIIVFGIVACTVGDNIGFFVGRHGGRPLLARYQRLFRISDRTLAHGERLFERYGAITIFFARFVFGMRIIAGPLAGVLRMPWRRFLIFNFLGASVWVTTIAVVGYVFGSQWERLVSVLGKANAVIAVVAVFLIAWAIRAHRRRQEAAAEEPMPPSEG